VQDEQYHERYEQVIVDFEGQVFAQQSEGYGLHNSILRDTQSSEKINDCKDQKQPMYEPLEQD
jgi:hypothetical protein